MLINDLEFMIPCGRESANQGLMVRGGSAFAHASVTTGHTDSGAFASSSAYAGGDRSGVGTATGVAFVNESYYVGGYTAAYAVGVGADSSGAFVSDLDYSFSLV